MSQPPAGRVVFSAASLISVRSFFFSFVFFFFRTPHPARSAMKRASPGSCFRAFLFQGFGGIPLKTVREMSFSLLLLVYFIHQGALHLSCLSPASIDYMTSVGCHAFWQFPQGVHNWLKRQISCQIVVSYSVNASALTNGKGGGEAAGTIRKMKVMISL